MADDARDAYWWCKPEVAQELARRIAGAGTDLVRLEVRTDTSRHGAPMTFRVVTGGGKDALDGDLNDTWLCPPVCPGGGG